MFLIILILFILLILVIIINKKNTQQIPPGPKGLPLIGNLHQIPTTNIHLYFSKLSKIYGPITFLRLGSVPMILVQSSEIAKQVLKTNDHNFCTRPCLVGQQKLSYNGLDLAFTPYGDYYKEIRKICVVHLFSSKRAQSFAPIRKDEVLRMVNKIMSLSSKSKVTNLSELLVTVTSSIICRVAFGKRYDDEGAERSKFHSMLNEGEAMLVAPFISDYIPFMGWIDKLSGKYSKLERAFKELDKFYDEIIHDHLIHQENNVIESHDNNKKDIIDVLLQLRKEGCFGFDLTLNHIKALLMNIFMAGTDTSAIAVTWAMTELAKHPLIMSKAQSEIRTSISHKSFVDEDDLSKLRYLKAIVKETFRLHPPVPLLIVREALQKCTIGGYNVPSKTQLFVNVWSIGRDPEIWDDPHSFTPERFLGDGNTIDYRGNDFELIPFGAGRRICPGILLGIANVELILANLLYSFDWELPGGITRDDIDEDVFPGIAMHKKSPLCLVAHKFPHI